MMNAAYVYLQLYRLFDAVTPIPVDCGNLCGKACCQGDDSGMLLFPGEEDVYTLLNPTWSRLDKTDLCYRYEGKTYTVPILMCDGECDRYERPLSCRIFPLTPHLDKEGKLEIIVDPRGKGICPLAKAFHLSDFDEKFLKNVKKVFLLLMKNRQVHAFMKEYSAYLDEFNRFYD